MSEGDKPKRFYKEVSLIEQAPLFVVQLDGRTARTVGRHPLGAPSRSLAEAIAAEWDAQTEEIDLAQMPLTRLQGFALDGGDEGRAEWSEMVISYLNSDLLCYRAPDAELAKRQAEIWQPVLDKVGARLGVSFGVTEGIMTIRQSPVLSEGAHAILNQMSVAELFAVKLLTEVTGSGALALAVAAGDLSSEEAFSASRLDETYQEEKWGVDEEAAARAKALKRDFEDVVRFLTLTRA